MQGKGSALRIRAQQQSAHLLCPGLPVLLDHELEFAQVMGVAQRVLAVLEKEHHHSPGRRSWQATAQVGMPDPYATSVQDTAGLPPEKHPSGNTEFRSLQDFGTLDHRASQRGHPSALTFTPGTFYAILHPKLRNPKLLPTKFTPSWYILVGQVV